MIFEEKNLNRVLASSYSINSNQSSSDIKLILNEFKSIIGMQWQSQFEGNYLRGCSLYLQRPNLNSGQGNFRKQKWNSINSDRSIYHPIPDFQSCYFHSCHCRKRHHTNRQSHRSCHIRLTNRNLQFNEEK